MISESCSARFRVQMSLSRFQMVTVTVQGPPSPATGSARTVTVPVSTSNLRRPVKRPQAAAPWHPSQPRGSCAAESGADMNNHHCHVKIIIISASGQYSLSYY